MTAVEALTRRPYVIVGRYDAAWRYALRRDWKPGQWSWTVRAVDLEQVDQPTEVHYLAVTNDRDRVEATLSTLQQLGVRIVHDPSWAAKQGSGT